MWMTYIYDGVPHINIKKKFVFCRDGSQPFSKCLVLGIAVTVGIKVYTRYSSRNIITTHMALWKERGLRK